MARKHDLTGLQVGLLTVVWPIEQDGRTQGGRWLCRCECGGTSTPRAKDLRRPGNTSSCGCQRGRKRHSVTPRQLGVLRAVGDAGGRRWLAGLEHTTGVSPQRVWVIADTLERHGFLKRDLALLDSRWRVRLTLRPAGARHLAGLQPEPVTGEPRPEVRNRRPLAAGDAIGLTA